MINVKEAVQRALTEAQEFYANQELLDLALEEVERSDDGNYWLITLGFLVPNRNQTRGPLAALTGTEASPYVRKYKLFKIDAATGEVLAMKIRSV